jgi:predicted GTPase
MNKEPFIEHDELVDMVLLQGDTIQILINKVDDLESKAKYLESQTKLLKNRSQYD